MATPEPYPYRKLNYPINNLEQSFTQEQKLQTRSNIGIPSSVDNEDKVLMVDNAAGELVWAEAPNGLPDIASGDEGKFLSVENGEPAWTDVDIPEQVNADWDATSGVQEILNKPNLATVATTGQYADLLGKPDIPASTSELVNDSDFITASEAPVQDVKVDGSSVVDGNGVANISIPQFQQLNSDWDATSGVQEILNRPEVKPLVAGSNITITETPSSVEIAGIPTVQLNADWDATSGVQEILNKPSIPSGTQLVPAATASDADKVLTVNSQGVPEWLAKDGTDLFYVTYNVTTYDEIKAARDAGKWPVLIDSAGRVAPMVDFDYIGTSSSIQNVKFQVSEYDYHSDTDGADYYNTVYNLELEIDPDMHRTETWSVMHNYSSADWNAVSGPRVIRNKPDLSIYAETSDLATVATTGSYDDLVDKPSIPSAQVNADWDATSGVSEILNRPNLATVATTGDYSDLQNLPSIPAAQVNSDWSATSGVQEILNKPTVKQVVAGSNITITETASTFEISSTGGSQVNSDWDATSGVAEILNKPTIPTKTSDLTNDSGFVTLSDLPPEEVEVLTYGTSTLNDYLAALQSGKKIIVCKISDPDSGWRYVMQSQSSPFPQWSYDIGVVHYQLRLNYNGNPGWTTLTTNSTTSADAGKVFTVDQYGRQVWASGGGGGGGSQVNADWDATSGVAEILNKPTPKTLTAGANISISEGVGTLTISAAAGLPASTSADEGKCLVVDSNGDPEWGTGGKTYTGTDGVVVDNVNDTVGLEAPVDLVGGPGITVDNPDGNTVRVSLSTDPYNETVLWDGNGTPATISNLALSESVNNFERVRITFSSDLPGGSPPEKNIQDVERPTANGDWFSVVFSGGIATNLFHLYTGVFAFTTNGTKFTYHSIYHCWGHGSGSYEQSSGSIQCLKVVGIHRINGGN